MNLKDKKLIIFDFDGTLVDSMEVFADIAAQAMFEVFNDDIQEARKAYIRTSGLPFFQQLEEIHPGDERNSKAAELFETRKLVGYFDQKPYNDAADTIKLLKTNGILTAVSSNNFQNLVDEYSAKTPLGLDYALGFEMPAFEKGAPHFEYLLKETSLPKEQILFVGDSLKDAERAINFGIEFIGKTGLFSTEDFLKEYPHIKTIDNLIELKDLL